jgi:hypothetical protein
VHTSGALAGAAGAVEHPRTESVLNSFIPAGIVTVAVIGPLVGASPVLATEALKDTPGSPRMTVDGEWENDTVS